ncbi:MAG: hypothetical protein IKA22_00900 [Lentisphaeria bacterium]|nr:hypothetical protein [Lentisphaeria bacterium]
MKKIFNFLIVFSFLSVMQIQAADLLINLKRAEKLAVKDGRFSGKYYRHFVDDKDKCAELSLNKNDFKQHKKFKHIAGYNGSYSFMLSVPGMLDEVAVETLITNFADSKERVLQVEYSLDGGNFSKLPPVVMKGGKTLFKQTFNLQRKYDRIYIRFLKQEKDGRAVGSGQWILFQYISAEVSGKILKNEIKVESKNVQKEKNKYRLNEFFPLGPFWGWERTRDNAAIAGMDLWDFVDWQFKLLREMGCNTVWFVHLSGEDLHKVLQLADKHQLKVLAATSLLNNFYWGIPGLDKLDDIARKHVVEYGGYSSLLGYVLKDEPLLCSLENCSYFYEVLKKFDPERDAVAVVMNRQSPTFLKESVLPVICTDMYYWGSEGSTQTPNHPDITQYEISMGLQNYNRSAEMYGKTHWFMGQMFGDVWGRHYMRDDYSIVADKGCYLHWRMPTENEIRWQLWEAIRQGSKGLFIYVMHNSKPNTVPFDKVKPGSEVAKIYKKQEARAKIALSWNNGQKLTDEQKILPYNGGMTYPGGKPTPQMKVMGEVFRTLAPLTDLILKKKLAKFQTFFADDAKLNVRTFDTGNGKRYGVVVNRDLYNKRMVKVLLPENVTGVKDLTNGRKLAVNKSRKASFQEVSFELLPGGGTILEAEFASQYVGMMVCRETFDQRTIHRVQINPNAEIFNYGNFHVNSNRALRMKENSDTPVCVLKNLTNKKSANNTFALNMNMKEGNGTIYCMVEGKLDSVKIKAVNMYTDGEKTNQMHLRDEDFNGKKDVSAAQKSIVIGEKLLSEMPVKVPAGTTSLEFFIGNTDDYIDEIYVWYVPIGK